MKKLISLCVMSFVILLFGCTALPNDKPNSKLSNENSSVANNQSTNHSGVGNNPSSYLFISVHVAYPVYDSVEEIANAATNIYIGTVKNISYEIVDMENEKIDNSPKSQSSSRMLYTIYTVSVKTSLKGDNSSEIKIGRIGGLVGYNEAEQYRKMKESGLLSKYNGIPMGSVTDDSINLSIGGEYLFCTSRRGGDIDNVINLTQFAFAVDSDEAERLIALSK